MYRHQLGISQQALADRCGLTASMISHVETNKRHPNLANTLLIADGLGVSLDALFGRGSESTQGAAIQVLARRAALLSPEALELLSRYMGTLTSVDSPPGGLHE